MSFGLKNLAQTRAGGIQQVVDAVNDLLQAAVTRYNSEVGPRAFGRPPTEPIPTDRGRLKDFRGRIGSLIEHAFGLIVDEMLQNDDLVLAFNVIQQYPDFYLRDSDGNALLRIDFKALHDESDEYSARFDVPKTDVQPNDDLLIYLAWRWMRRSLARRVVVFPEVLQGLCVPAIEVAAERDLRQVATGGHIGDDGRPYVRARRRNGQPSPNLWSPDSNFGKIDRIVHHSRHRDELTINMQRFRDFASHYTAARTERSATAPTSDELSPA